MTDFGIITAVITGFGTTLVAVVTGLLTVFWVVLERQNKLHVAELKRKDEDLKNQRLYAAELESQKKEKEREFDALRVVDGRLRDRIGALETTLENAKIPIPSERRHGTKPLGLLIAEHLEQAK